ncbi:MAG TPA: YidC/Oxa1 family membrane protein insertase [Chloroflexia bacterium]|nr:YidC/Oxa1 family membrane protein insertase [Chloroflexia bacterium]
MGQIWDAIVNLLAGVIQFFATIGGGYTALGIILFTIAIRLLLLPLTLKAVRSSRAMQQLQPMIKEINERYKTKAGERLSPEKSQKKQAEIMALYSEYSVNPAAGCLPVLIQIPIFFAVYGAVTKSIASTDPAMNLVQHAWGTVAPAAADALKSSALANTHDGFLWIPSLGTPDPIYVLPILMMIGQFMTQRMAMPKGGGADEQQRRINGIMQWMPLIFGFTALNFPSGPVLYWVTTSVFSTVQQFFITGWGSLSDIPGLGWLPQREIKKIELKKRDPNKPVKPGLMQRLAENQERMQAQVQATKTANTSADAGSNTEVIEGEIAPAKPTFGRKVNPESTTLRTSGSIRKSADEGVARSETRAANQEEAIRQAYQNLNRRPPKKNGPATGTGGPGTTGSNTNPGGSSGNGRKKK